MDVWITSRNVCLLFFLNEALFQMVKLCLDTKTNNLTPGTTYGIDVIEIHINYLKGHNEYPQEDYPVPNYRLYN